VKINNKKVLLLLGSSGGLGNELVKLLKNEYIVIQHYFKNKPLGPGLKIKANITSKKEARNLVEIVIKNYGKIDILINLIGISIDGFVHKQKLSYFKKVIDINLVGTFNIVNLVLPSMRSNKYGRVILISSVVSQNPILGTSAYASSKYAIQALNRSIAIENAKYGITSVCISLGYFNYGIINKLTDNFKEEILSKIPLKRFGNIQELKTAIKFIIKNEGDYKTFGTMID
jgi:NAD(P)-dependent dehydrogenase (short-subunit alcohol dehydrogenase family)